MNKNAKRFGIKTKEGKNMEPFMALPLQDDQLANIKGRFYENTVFKVKANELAEFEKQFPFKEKHKTDTQFR